MATAKRGWEGGKGKGGLIREGPRILLRRRTWERGRGREGGKGGESFLHNLTERQHKSTHSFIMRAFGPKPGNYSIIMFSYMERAGKKAWVPVSTPVPSDAEEPDDTCPSIAGDYCV